MSYDNTNRGTLGKNARREKESHPEYAGKCDIDGKMYWISAWVKAGQGGEKFFSLSFRPQDEKPKEAPPKSHGGGFSDANDDIPF